MTHSRRNNLAGRIAALARCGAIAGVVAGASLSSMAAAQQGDPRARPAVAASQGTDTLRLDALLDAVARANPRLAAARSRAEAARARVPGTTRPADPQLQLGWMNYELPGLGPMDGIGMTQLQVMQMLPLAGKLRLAGRAESARADAVAAGVMDEAAALRARASMLFYDLHATDAALASTRAARRVLQDVAAITARMYEVGEGRQADVLRANVELARMDAELVGMEAMRAATVSRLNALRNLRLDAAVGAPRLPAYPADLPSLDSLLRLADARRPTLRAAAAEVDAASAAAQLSARELWPDLQLGVQYGQQPGEGGAQRMGSLMVGASVPVFARRRQQQMRQEAEAMRAAAAAELAAMRLDTEASVGESFASLTRARRLAALYRNSVLPQADAAAIAALTAYRAGTGTFMGWLDAQMSRLRYARELSGLEADEGRAWAELEMLTGIALIDRATRAPGRDAGGSSQ